MDNRINTMSFGNKVLITLLLAVLSLAGNFVNLTLFYGISFIFGSVAVMLAVTVLGTWSAVIVAAIGGCYTIVLWGHPYALIVFTIEALVVSLLYRRGPHNLVLIDLIYWLVIGVPLVLLFYTQGVKLDFEPSLLVALKQFLNGVFNALLVASGLIIWQLLFKKQTHEYSRVGGTSLLFNTFLLVTLSAGISPVIYEGQRQLASQESLLTTQLQQHASDVVELLAVVEEQSVEQQQHLLKGFTSRYGIRLAILAENGSVITQSGTINTLTGGGEISEVNNKLRVWRPFGEMSAMQRWQKSVYFYNQPFYLTSQSMTLLIERPAEKMVNMLKKEHLRLFIMLSVIFVSAVVLIYILSNVIMRPLRKLEAISKHIADDVAQGELFQIPNIRIREYQNLAQSLWLMGEKLSESFRNLEQAHSMLEVKVEKRTQELNQSTRAMQSVLDASTQFSIISTGVDGVITLFNSGAEKMLGYPAKEVVGNQTPALFHLTEEVSQRATQLSTLLGNEVSGFAVFTEIPISNGFETREWTYVTKQGKHLLVSLTVTTQKDSDGKIIGFLGIAEDISERKRIDRMKNEFVSTVSHELRTPLTSISGALGLLTNGTLGELSPQAQKMTDIAYKNSQRLSHLINDLLDMEKIVAGKMRFDLHAKLLNSEIEQAIESHQTFIHDKQIQILLENRVPETQVIVDSMRLQQVLANILSNAIKFSPQNGTINILVQSIKGHVRVSISDTGPGISMTFRDRIFEKFAQEDSSDSRVEGGTGLGLAITKELIEIMGGEIGFESIEGQGATFWFELPLASNTLNNSERLSLPSKLYRVLVVESDNDVANVLLNLLTKRGYCTDVVYNGHDALTALSNTEYDAISLNPILHDMSGRELIEELDKNPKIANIPILVLSANLEEGQQGLAINHSKLNYLSKPFDERRLIKTIDALVETTTCSQIKVLHVEDDTDLHHVVNTMLGERFDLELVTSLEEARQMIALEQFDIVILDIFLPDGSGLELISECRHLQPQASVIILSAIEVSEEEANSVEAVLLKSQITASSLLEALSCEVKNSLKTS